MYSITLDNTQEHVALNKWRLNVWVSACEGFDDPGFFLLHAKTNLLNRKAPPAFETFANPCSLVEYKFGAPERPHGMYRDRKASFMFSNEYRMKEFLRTLDERRTKLVDLMTFMEDSLENAPSEIIGPVSIKKSDESCPFMRIKATCTEGAPFIYKDLGSPMPKFVGVDACFEKEQDMTGQPELDILTYTTRGKLLYPHLVEDINTWRSHL